MFLGERSELLGRGLKTNARTNRTECVSVLGAPADDNRPAGLGERESGRVQHADGNRPLPRRLNDSHALHRGERQTARGLPHGDNCGVNNKLQQQID